MAWTLSKSPKSRYLRLSEEVVDDSSKDLVAADINLGAVELEILAIRIEFTATASVGTRTLRLQLLDASDSDLLLEVAMTRTVTAGNSQNYNAAPGLDAATADHEVLPAGLFLAPNQILRILDSSATDAAADDMIVHVLGRLASKA